MIFCQTILLIRPDGMLFILLPLCQEHKAKEHMFLLYPAIKASASLQSQEQGD